MAIFQLFFPDFPPPSNYVTDPYSEKLSKIVFYKFYNRFNQEDSFDFQYTLKGDGGYDIPPSLSIANAAKWIPWLVRPVVTYLLPPPPPDDKVWLTQDQEIRNAQKKLTDEQRQAVYYWAGLAGLGSGDWRSIANQYLFQNNVPIAKAFLVRASLAMGLYDSAISYLSAKYKYSVMRPHVRDPSIEPLIPVPQHPSYPSGHSTEATVSKLILNYYFPSEKKKWDNLAQEAGLSRIWGGVHYPIDDEAGKALGTMIGNQILNVLREQEVQDEKAYASMNTPSMAH
jgi:membrane-associated phospholipid phosphatase